LRSLKKIKDSRRVQAIEEALTALINSLEEAKPPHPGLGLKQLRDRIWEIRSSLHDRVIFKWHDGNIFFLLAGNHDDIRRFLKNI